MRKSLKRLIMIVMIVCLLGISFDIYVIFTTYGQTQRYNQIINEYSYNEAQMKKLGQEIYHIQTLAMVGLMSDDEYTRQSIWQQMDELDKKNKEILKGFDNTLHGDDEIRVYHELYSDYLTYSSRQTLITQISSEDSISTAKYFLNNTMKESMDRMNSSLEKLEEMMDDDIVSMRVEVSQSTRLRNIVTCIIAVITAIAIIYLIVFVYKSGKNINLEFVDSDKKHKDQIYGMQQQVVEGMAELVESRDNSTGTHIKNTAAYVGMIAKQLAKNDKYKAILSDDYITKLIKYAPLHDVGKILVSDNILLKPGRLTDEEFEQMKLHAKEGGVIVERLLAKIESEENVKIASDIATYHHEWWNGKGYPMGVSGEEIPLSARIMAVADVFDALISVRCYKKSFTIEEAYNIINEDSGTHFEPDIVEAFMALRPQIELYLKTNAR